MKRIAQILSQLALTQVILAFAAIVRNKVLALRLSRATNGAYVLVTNAGQMFFGFAQFGLSVALSRNIAAAETQEERQNYLACGNGITVVTSALVFLTCLVMILSGGAGPAFGLSADPIYPWMLLFLVGLSVFESWRQNNFALLQGVVDVKGMSAERAYGVLAVSVISIPIVWFFGLQGALIQTALLTIILAFVHANRVRHLGFHPFRLKFDPTATVVLLKYGFAALLTSVALSVTDTALRTSLEYRWGLETVALMNAGSGPSTQIKAILLAGIINYSVSTLSAAKTPEEQSRVTADLLTVVLPPATAIMGLVIVAAPPLVHLLFSAKYVAGASIAGMLAIGDYMQTLDYVVGGPLLAQGRVKTWAILDLIWFALRLCIGLVVMNTFGLYAIPFAAAVSMAVHLGLKLILYWTVCKLTLPVKLVVRAAVGLVAVGAVAFLVGYKIPFALPASLLILGAIFAFDCVELKVVERLRGLLLRKMAPQPPLSDLEFERKVDPDAEN